MIKQAKMSECLGRRLVAFEASGSSDQAVLVFEGNVFTVLEASNGWDGDHADIAEADGMLDVDSFNGDALVRLGICTRAERDERERQIKSRYAQQQLEWDRRAYEQLRKKFEGK